MSFDQIIQKTMGDSLDIFVRMRESNQLKIQIIDATEALLEQYKKGGCLYVAGNGGSAADAQHMVAELVSKLHKDRTPIKAFALTVDTSILTAIGNDYGYEHSFSRQVAACVSEKDVFLAITTSGNSPNILKAMEQAKTIGAKVILLSGDTGGKAKALADVSILAPSSVTPLIQQCHLVIYHLLCECLEKGLIDLGKIKYCKKNESC
jgi:D-sedoheptulose 7-phosphate isomerase